MDAPDPKAAIELIAENLGKVRAAMVRGGARGLYLAGELIITDAKENYCPVRDGILRASGFVNEPVLEEADASVTIGFGGAAEAYALEQHERMDFHHTVGGPKYLERPVMAHAGNGDIQALIAQEIRAELAGGI